jgi:hypothetical protein
MSANLQETVLGKYIYKKQDWLQKVLWELNGE